MSMDSDWDFIVALATMAVVVAGVVLLYMFVTHARTAAANRRDRAASQAPEPEIEPPEPMFFRRYSGGAPESGRHERTP
jgi:hypothetical protein